MRFVFFTILSTLLFSCSEQENGLRSITLQDLEGNNTTLGAQMNQTLFACVFLSPECPLSENYTKTINNFAETYADSGLHFICIFPGEFYTQQQIKDFIAQYHLHAPVLLDPDLTLTHMLHATTTPEVFLFDENDSLRYQGCIDNWYVDLGQQRQVITAYYFRDALQSVLHKGKVDIVQTEPVGCLIEMTDPH